MQHLRFCCLGRRDCANLGLRLMLRLMELGIEKHGAALCLSERCPATAESEADTARTFHASFEKEIWIDLRRVLRN